MLILITGTAGGIGKACAEKFLNEGHCVVGFDVKESTITGETEGRYTHYVLDVRDASSYPDIKPDVLINNAGVQNSEDDIETNLKAVISVTEHYAFGNENIKSVVMIGSASAHTGSEFPYYAASKGGILSYTKNVANRLAPQAICNSIDPGGVTTELNLPVMEDEKLWNAIMELTPLKRWASPEEIADWVYFVAVVNRFMTGQNLLIDGGEAGNTNFIWPEE